MESCHPSDSDRSLGTPGLLWLVLHLMIAGRLHWKAPSAKLAGRNALAAFDFPNGSLVLTEAGSKRRASLYVVQGEDALCAMDPGGVEIFETDLDGFRAALTEENRTLKRALTDPRLISGVGNAYSDEILHAATALADNPDPQAKAGGMGAAVRGNSRNHANVDRPARCRGNEGIPREGDGIPAGNGGTWSVQFALSAVRRKAAAHPLCGQ